MMKYSTYDPKIHHRRSIRLRGYDYSRAGRYFITICSQNRLYLFGEIVDDAIVLNNAGRMIEQIWHEIPTDFNNVYLCGYTTMPNHIHGIIEIAPTGTSAAMGDIDLLPQIIQSFKRHTTIEYIKMVKQGILSPFDKRIWQRNYWEHIIRNENEYSRIAKYILDNPAKWATDKLNGGSGNQVMELPAIYNADSWMV